MSTDDDKKKLSKLLEGLEIPDIKLTERCFDLVKEFHKKFDKEVEEEEHMTEMEETPSGNPYKPPQEQLDEISKKLKELQKKITRPTKQEGNVTAPTVDPKRPWRTHSTTERLLRINNELKYHHEKGAQSVAPLEDNVLKTLIKEGEEEKRNSEAPPVTSTQLRDVVEKARRNLPNFQYRKIIVDNTTATEILRTAHVESAENVTSSNDNKQIKA